ncbi:MAG: DNA polymerase III subunit delta [Gammaproteobacteria bacterium]|nr:DNA polymerase III subunit delta [Gammaproteobacteria bacterium]
MKLSSNELAKHLAKAIHSIYFISGVEDLLIIESLDQIRKAAISNDFTDKVAFTVSGQFNWSEVDNCFKNQSLFGGKQFVEIHIPSSKPGKKGSEAITNLIANLPEDALLVVVAGKLEKSTKQAKWVKELLKHATVIDCQKVYPSQFPSWLQNRLTAYDLGIDRDALEMFVALTEGNLIVAKQSIERLLMMEVTGRVTMEDVSQCVADGAHFDLFQLTEAAIMRKPERVYRIFERLKSEGTRPEQMLAVLYWEIKNLMDASLDIDNGLSVKQAMQKANIWQSKQKIIGPYLASQPKEKIDQLVHQACKVDNVIKGVDLGSPWEEIGLLLFMFSVPEPA